MTDAKDKDTAALTAEESSPEEDLDAIMQELEAIDQETEQQAAPASEVKPAAELEPEAMQEPIAAKPAPAPTDNAPAPTPAPAATVTPISSAPAKANDEGGEQCLALKLSGSMQLQLEFASGDRMVTLEFNDDALVCRFGDGTEVRIPTDNAKGTPLKRSA